MGNVNTLHPNAELVTNNNQTKMEKKDLPIMNSADVNSVLQNDRIVTNCKETNIEKEETKTNMCENDLATKTSRVPLDVSIEDHLSSAQLPDQLDQDDDDFNNKLKVFNNYRTFGAMYFSKNNLKKAEWAFKNGIKQATSCEALSKHQLRCYLTAEVEFRLSRARCLHSMGNKKEAEEECEQVLKIEHNSDAEELLRSLS